MPKHDFSLHPAEETPRGVARILGSLLFGFAVWGAHLLLIYAIAAVACSPLSDLGLRPALVKSILAGLTVLALLMVTWHGWTHYRRAREDSEGENFISWLNAMLDGAAAVAILWQAFPILTVPLCL